MWFKRLLWLSFFIISATQASPEVISAPTLPFKRPAVSVLTQPYQIKIILSNDLLFVGNTAKFSQNYRQTLNQVGSVVQASFKMHAVHSIIVRSWLNQRRSDLEECALRQARAQHVAAYLWATGIPERQLLVPVSRRNQLYSTPHTLVGGADNRRTEVIIRFARRAL